MNTKTTCDVCGAPATVLARDMIRREVDGRELITTGDTLKSGCALHPVESQTVDAPEGSKDWKFRAL